MRIASIKYKAEKSFVDLRDDMAAYNQQRRIDKKPPVTGISIRKTDGNITTRYSRKG